jgi:maltose alpha-D-glucosyltransferase/alpha-amylase
VCSSDLVQFRLGDRTAEMHRAFALAGGDPAFAPEPTRPADLREWSRAVMALARRAFAVLRLARRAAAEGLRDDIDRVLAQRRDLLDRLARLVPARLDAVRTRLHGDFHLGHVMIVRDDVQILDFDDGSAAPFRRRPVKGLPLRDVAAMLRSFDQVAWTALSEHAAAHPDLLERLRPLAAAWERRTAAVFLERYEATIDGCPSSPADDGARRRLLRLFLLERLFGEILDAAISRPDWLRVPVAGLLCLLAEKEPE